MKITLPTNLNNKLRCNAFTHIAPAPAGGVPESKMEQQYSIHTADDSYPPTPFVLVDLLRLPLGSLYSIHTLPSHGMDRLQFLTWYMVTNPGANVSTPMAVYYYKRK